MDKAGGGGVLLFPDTPAPAAVDAADGLGRAPPGRRSGVVMTYRQTKDSTATGTVTVGYKRQGSGSGKEKIQKMTRKQRMEM